MIPNALNSLDHGKIKKGLRKKYGADDRHTDLNIKGQKRSLHKEKEQTNKYFEGVFHFLIQLYHKSAKQQKTFCTAESRLG